MLMRRQIHLQEDIIHAAPTSVPLHWQNSAKWIKKFKNNEMTPGPVTKADLFS
jgi:hypothetical protein